MVEAEEVQQRGVIITLIFNPGGAGSGQRIRLRDASGLTDFLPTFKEGP